MLMRMGWMMLAGASVAMAQDAVKVSPAEISEKRSTTFIKKENFFSSDHDGVTLTLHVEGATVAGATKYGAMKIDLAKDDVGTALKLATSGFHSSEKFSDISRFGRSEKTSGFDVPVELTLPARKAGALVEVKGELQVLAGGEEKVVEVSKLPSLVGKTVDDPALKAAGLTMTIVKIDPAQREVAVDFTGSADALQEVDAVDGAGKKISGGSMMMNLGIKRSATYDLTGPIDDAVTLKLHLVVGQKSVTVPFDLKNVKLP